MSTLHALRSERPRLYRAPDDPAFGFPTPRDPVRRRILRNVLADAEALAARRPARAVPLYPDSPHPFHQLYVSFFAGMEAAALIEHYSFAWRMTRDVRWLKLARLWLQAAVRWEHSDRVEEHFYTANRYMQALAVALDWLAGALTEAEEQAVVQCLIELMERWWPEVNAQRHSPEGGHHAVVDNGHFGVAALQLLDRHPPAAEWVDAVVDRFRAAIMPRGCGPDGDPVDGPQFWGLENMWMLQFADALRNVTGHDLYREFPDRVKRPLLWMRYHLAPPAHPASAVYADPNAQVLNGAGYTQLDAISPVLLRLAQDAGDAVLRDLALREPRLGRVLRVGMVARGCRAEYLYNFAPYAYLFVDTHFKPNRRPARAQPLARAFRYGRAGQSVILRSGWEANAVVVDAAAYDGGCSHNPSNIHVQWRGYPLVKTISAAETAPMACGNGPCVGGQQEIVSRAEPPHVTRHFTRLALTSPRVVQHLFLLHGPRPALVVLARRRPRAFAIGEEQGRAFVRFNGADYLQYPAAPFNPDAGLVRLRARLHAPDATHTQCLFHTGLTVPGTGLGTAVNGFVIKVTPEHTLTFAVQNQRYVLVETGVPLTPAMWGQWLDIEARWGGFNGSGGPLFIELSVNGHTQRFDDPAVFGELGRDSQGLASRRNPRVFFIRHHTPLAFGGAVFPNTGMVGDLASMEVRGADRAPWRVDFEHNLGDETGGAALAWRYHPVALQAIRAHEALLGAGRDRVRVIALTPDVACVKERIPYFPAGLPAASVKHVIPGHDAPATCVTLRAAPKADTLGLLWVDRRARVRLVRHEPDVELMLNGRPYRLAYPPAAGYECRTG